eukprot:CAMPEP_0184349412 /NCGR_PEP_ID=MMETSP1089-20130417/32503_1 /TAXON_ID=38269 ORGANISM="Gloeochaete wittrockiana, Strain SAG46.84" /NCGR_SAMPLE_ID=MMETSP1089 /ASSEMBLY_ACC=CAM_ASM_000445 /LENGTH=559 /DNA_ID=CAMNT_0026681583 /DNA_START=22 /DNA_END=1701 /DNA_ORIENTATION=+
MAEQLPFVCPSIEDNPLGWGPSAVPEALKGLTISLIPSATTSVSSLQLPTSTKSDMLKNPNKLSRIADWMMNMQRGKARQISYAAERDKEQFGFGYFHEKDDDFTLVDSGKVTTRGRGSGQRRFDSRGGRGGGSRGGRGGSRGGGKNFRGNNRKRPSSNEQKHNLDASVYVKPDWEELNQIDTTILAGLSFEPVEGEDIVTCGEMKVFDPRTLSINTRNEKQLDRTKYNFYNPTTGDDEIIRDLANKDEVGNVFMTDTLLAYLMASPRSVFSWDIIMRRVGSKLFFDKREDSPLDYLTVNETGLEIAYEEKDLFNSPEKLSEEATYVNRQFTQHILSKTSFPLEHTNPFVNPQDDDPSAVPAAQGFRYRRFVIDEEIDLVVRCQIDSVAEDSEGNVQYLVAHAINEFDPKFNGMDWRQKLDSQRAGVLATELRNNSFKLALFCARAFISGADSLLLGFVARQSPKDPKMHSVLGVQKYKPDEFATQINWSINNGWGIIKALVENCMELPEGKYLLLKEPSKPLIRVYSVPANAFEQDEEEDDGLSSSRDANDDEEEDDE